MHGGHGPDLLGVCEIENQPVAEKLIGALLRQDYQLAHVEAPDIRGIDCSLIFSQDVFEVIGDPIRHLDPSSNPSPPADPHLYHIFPGWSLLTCSG